MAKQTSLKLSDGSRVAVIGGGPAGSFFSYFLLDMAARVGLDLQVDVFEPRDFTLPGPPGCNMCAGVVSESLVQLLAAEGINMPTSVVQRGLDAYVLHMDVGSVRIESQRHEKRIGAAYRGLGPAGLTEIKGGSLDGHLLALAVSKGARHIRGRVDEVRWAPNPARSDPQDRRVQLKIKGGAPEIYDLVAVTTGVNTAALKLFQALEFGYQAPRTTKCFVREYYLGEEAITTYVGSAMHAFLLNVPRLEFAALIPKGDYVTLALLGEDIDGELLQTFLADPAVKRCLPPDFPLDQGVCQCAPRINVRGSQQPFGDRLVFIGDCGVTRLYKDGIGAAYRAAKAAAATAVFEGISAEDFKRRYWPTCRAIETDNTIGKLIFAIVREIQKRGLARRAVWRMVSREQQGQASADRGMSMVLWDMFTGSASYGEIFRRTLHPVFWLRFLGALAGSLGPFHRGGPKFGSQDTNRNQERGRLWKWAL